MTLSEVEAIYEDAWLYDQEFRDRARDVAFFRNLATTIGGPVLELACGTGRISQPIAEARLEVVGVDVSEPMLERARARARDAGVGIEYLLGDVRTFDIGRRFRLAFIAANALQHLHDVRSLLAFFDRARAHLHEEGTLALDVFQPDLGKLARASDSVRPHKTFALDDGRVVQVDLTGAYLRDVQILRFVLTYRCEGTVLRTKDVRMRCFFPEELLALCRLAGFEVMRRIGDYDGSAFTSTSPKQILLCRPRRGIGGA